MIRKSEELFQQMKAAIVEEATEDLIASMRSGAIRPAAVRAPKATTKKSKGIAKRSPEALAKLTKDLLSFIKRKPASTMLEIKEGLKASTLDLQFPMRKLKEEKLISGKGAGPKTRYTAKGTAA